MQVPVQRRMPAGMRMKLFTIIYTIIFCPCALWAQVADDSLLQQATLENIVAYTLKHQPAVQKSALDEQITRSQVNSRLSQWYPEIDFDYNLQHNFQLQTAVFAGQQFPVGTYNTSTPAFAYSQNVFSGDLVLAAITAHDTRRLASQTTTSNKIDAVANVSKAFYDVLLTQQQIKVTEEDILRLERSVKDAQSQYRNGIVDKTDYQRATILLNNANAQKKNDTELIKAKVAYLKSLMGYPASAPLEVVYDSAALENETGFDISQQVSYDNRIEYQMLQTQKRLKLSNLKYTKIAFTPTIQGFAGYDLNYFANTGAELYKNSYPSSFAGISLVFPIVNGGRRWMNIRQAKWQLKKTDWDITDAQNNISAQYAQAVAAYNVNLENYNTIKSNLDLSREVYKIIELQYRSGVKTYLEVLTAETDLRSSQINYFNALYQLLSAKIDLQRALGQLKY
jgi:outer membrane protein